VLALTVEQAEEIMMRKAKKMADPDGVPISIILIDGLQDTFPCDEELATTPCANFVRKSSSSGCSANDITRTQFVGNIDQHVGTLVQDVRSAL
jgi:hypothetical protein